MVAELENIEGTVSRVNGKCFQLAGRPGWLGLSRYAKLAPALPSEGQGVAVSLDRAGYVRAVEVQAVSLPMVPPEPQKGASVKVSAPACPPDKDTRITRMNGVTNTIAVLSSGGLTEARQMLHG